MVGGGGRFVLLRLSGKCAAVCAGNLTHVSAMWTKLEQSPAQLLAQVDFVWILKILFSLANQSGGRNPGTGLLFKRVGQLLEFFV